MFITVVSASMTVKVKSTLQLAQTGPSVFPVLCNSRQKVHTLSEKIYCLIIQAWGRGFKSSGEKSEGMDLRLFSNPHISIDVSLLNLDDTEEQRNSNTEILFYERYNNTKITLFKNSIS